MVAQAHTTLRKKKTFLWSEESGNRPLETGACWGNPREKRADVRGDSRIVSMNPQRSSLTHELRMHRTDQAKT